MQQEGRPISTVVFPDTGHGILEFETGADGERTSTRYADGYYRLVIDWVRDGHAKGQYGSAQFLMP